MRSIKAVTLFIVALAVTATPVLARVCPVTGQSASEDYSAGYKGKLVYFSCELARQEFLAGPEQYLEALKHADEVEKTAQVLCPVSNEQINRSVWADYNGKRVYLHCKIARKSFHKTPEVYYKKLIEGNIALEDTPPLDTRFIGASEGARFAR